MSSIVNSLVGSLTLSNLWVFVLPLVPLVLLIFGVVFGLNILRDFITTKKVENFFAGGGSYEVDEDSAKYLRREDFWNSL